MKRATILAGAVIVLCLSFGCSGRSLPAADETYWQAAQGAARWLDASAIRTPVGLEWPPDPTDPKTSDSSLYSGTPGVVLFYLEAGAAAESRGLKSEAAAFLEKAKSGAAALLGKIPEFEDAGLYSGLSGIGYVLQETYKATGDIRFRNGFKAVLGRILALARKAGNGFEWGSVTDIIGGTAGVGLFLLYADAETGESTWRTLASRAGDRLIEIAKSKNGGLDWAMDPSYPRLMPNFAHGTAGVAFFLSRLFEATKKKEYLDAALAGAKYLLSIADTGEDTCLIYHHEPDGTDLYYLGWCHGPVGTANLFQHLARVTGDPTWRSWVRKEARSLISSGIPEKETPGFWNNAGICCGLAGVADFFLHLYTESKETEDRDFGRRVMRVLLGKAAADDGRMKWIQAEHRTRPEFLIAQTGLMQGAAGIGLVFLRYDAFEHGRMPAIRLPDSAF